MQRNDTINFLFSFFMKKIAVALQRKTSPSIYKVNLILLLFFMSVSVSAQDFRGVLYGQVKDSSGALIFNATVTAQGPSQTYTGASGRNGAFTIPFVQPGRYNVSVEAQGFKTEVQNNVFVDISQKSNLNFVLRVGASSETVTVQADIVGLNAGDASGGTVIDPEKVQNLPLNGRQVYMLLALTPGVKFTTTEFGAGGGHSGTRGWDETNAYSISGQQGVYNQFLLGGAPISQQNGGGAGTWNISPSIDAIEQVKVMTATYDAQYGRTGGGAINIVLKSGTPHFHGTLFDFWRNSVLDANVYQANQIGSPRPYHNQHQYGGTVGGPFLKKNAYFFFSFEGWREVLPAAVLTSVPAADLYPDASGNVNLTNYLAGVSKTGIYDPLTTTCSASGACTRAQFPNNTIPANRISPIGLKILKLFPAPNRAGYQNNYVFNGKDRYSYNMPIARVDYNFSDRTRLYGEFAWWSGLEYRNNSGLSGPAVTGNINNYRSSLTQVLDLTHTFTPTLVSDVRVSFNRAWNRNPNGAVSAGLAAFSAADLGLTMPQIPTTTRQWAPQIALGDGFPGVIGNTGDPSIFETYDLGPSLTQTIKGHNLHYGGEVSLYHDVSRGVGQPNGNFSFGTGFTQQNPFRGQQDGSVIASLLLGYPNGGSVQDTLPPYESYKYYAAFVQDDWKVRSNLTLNIGLRWDTETSPVERHNHLLAGVCLTCVNPLSTQITYPAGGTLPNGAPLANPLLGAVQFSSGSLTAYENTLGVFQPKFGFSYAVNRNVLLRGGWALGKAIGMELGGANAWNLTTGYNSSPDGGLHPAPDFRNGTPFPNGFTPVQGDSLGAATLVGNGLSIDQRGRKIPLVQQYTFGFQAALPGQVTAELGYLGSRTVNLRAPRQLNGLSAGDFQRGHDDPNYLNQQVTNPVYGVLPKTVSLGQNPTVQAKTLMVPYPIYNGSVYVYTDPRGYSNYNSMIAKLEKRLSGGGALSKGLSFLTSFTWSKVMDGTGYLNNSGAGLVDATPSYVVDGTDRPWVLAFSGLYGLPIGRGGLIAKDAHGLLGTALNDWQLNWIFTNNSGTPVGYPNGDIYSCGAYNAVSNHKTWSSYINNSQAAVSCFSKFPQYTAVTMLPRTSAVRNPWAQQTQLGLQKKFPIKDNMKLQFKVEAFNATNTPIFGGPNTGNPEGALVRNQSVADASQPGAWSGYGTISSTQQNFPRQLQLSLKLAF
jgi:hypothetical protein